MCIVIGRELCAYPIMSVAVKFHDSLSEMWYLFISKTHFVILCPVMIIVATGFYRIFICKNGLPVMEKSFSLTLFHKKSGYLTI